MDRPSLGDYRVVPWYARACQGRPRKGAFMEGQSTVSLIILLFVLRLGVPLLITVAIAYGLHRLDAKWQAEAEAEAKAQIKTVTAPAPQLQPLRNGNGTGYSIPIRQPTAAAVAAGQPCWVVKGCSESMRATCAAYNQPNLSCWMARTQAEGRLPAPCADCKLYQPMAVMRTEQRAVLH